MRKVAQVSVLCSLLNCDLTELERINKTTYRWQGLLYEVVGAKSLTAPASHYVMIKQGSKKWGIRELGSKSKIARKLNAS